MSLKRSAEESCSENLKEPDKHSNGVEHNTGVNGHISNTSSMDTEKDQPEAPSKRAKLTHEVNGDLEQMQEESAVSDVPVTAGVGEDAAPKEKLSPASAEVMKAPSLSPAKKTGGDKSIFGAASSGFSGSFFNGFGATNGSSAGAFGQGVATSSPFGLLIPVNGNGESSWGAGGASGASTFGAATGAPQAWGSKAVSPPAPGEAKEEDENAEEVEIEPKEQREAFPGLLDASAKVLNGEQNEKCVHEVNAKLYRLDKRYASNTTITADTSAAQRRTEETSTELPPIWVQLGVGPVRLLRSTLVQASDSEKDDKHTTHEKPQGRILMRRESNLSKKGTEILLNVALKCIIDVAKQGDFAVRMGVLEQKGVPPKTYVFRLKEAELADTLLAKITEELKRKNT